MGVPTINGYSGRSEAIFYDDFYSDQLDLDKWNVMVTGKIVNNEQQAYVRSSETIYIAKEQELKGSNGHTLVLHPRFRPGHTTSEGKKFDFLSGRIDTREKFEFNYGIVAARMKLSAGTGLWPAFWAMGKGDWPDAGEIDVMENVGEADWVSAAVHGPNYSGEAGLVNYAYFHSEFDATNWHVYSAVCSPERLEFFVDGVLIYRVTRPMAEFFGNWVFDNKKYLVLNIALGGTYPFKVNGVRKPYYGIPEKTVQLVKQDQAKVVIDWVGVYPLE
jgi:beta-glucanase (GH16 family)